MVRYVLLRNSELTPESSKIKDDYIRFRSEVHAKQYGPKKRYDAADEWDKDPATIYIIAMDNEKVAAGARYTVSTPEHRIRLRFESPHDHLKIENLMPHVDAATLGYAELGGVIVAPEHAPLGLVLQEHALKLYKDGDLLPNVDVVVGRVSRWNGPVVARAAESLKLNGVLRGDIKVEIDGQPRSIMMCARNSHFSLVTEEMLAHGASRHIQI